MLFLFFLSGDREKTDWMITFGCWNVRISAEEKSLFVGDGLPVELSNGYTR